MKKKKDRKDEYQNKLEENMVNTIDYTNNKINEKNNVLGFLLLGLSIMMIIIVLIIFKEESRWRSLFGIIAISLFIRGLGLLFPKLSYIRRMVIFLSSVIVICLFLLGFDYINVKRNNIAPRFTKNIVTIDNTILYDTFFYDVYRCNVNEDNEFWDIEKNSKYTDDTIRNYGK